MFLMKLYSDDLKRDLYKNIRKQIEIQNDMLDLKKGNLVVKKRYNEEYFYLSYRDNNTVKTDYLGKLNSKEITKIKKELDERKKLKEELKNLREEENELRKIILAVNRRALIKNVYGVMDLIVLIRPILVWSKAKEAYLFGSYARGEMNETSDINIELVECRKEKKIVEEKISKATNKVVNVLFNEEYINPALRETIEEEKLLIYSGTN